MSNKPEPPPTARPDRPASWPQVIAFTEKAFPKTEERDALIAAMSERDFAGRAKYGVPLTSGNGRKHLVDAWQESMDLAGYLRTELEERGVDPMKVPMESDTLSPDVLTIVMTFAGAVQTALLLQTLVMGNDVAKTGLIPGVEPS